MVTRSLAIVAVHSCRGCQDVLLEQGYNTFFLRLAKCQARIQQVPSIDPLKKGPPFLNHLICVAKSIRAAQHRCTDMLTMVRSGENAELTILADCGL